MGKERQEKLDAPAPQSWAEDLKSYRESRGSRCLGAVHSADDCPARYAITLRGGSSAALGLDPAIQSERFIRHGWGAGTTSLSGDASILNVTSPANREPTTLERGRLFDVLAQTQDRNALDIWIGNPLINPAKGKGHTPPFHDPRSVDISVVLNQRDPGVPGDDAWLGHINCRPSQSKDRPNKGKESTDTVDAWIGNIACPAGGGKKPLLGVEESSLRGATFREDPNPLPQSTRRPTTAHVIVDDLSPMKQGKKILPHPQGEVKIKPDLYAMMTFKPLTVEERHLYSEAPHDGKSYQKKRQIKPPRVVDSSEEMLSFKPENRVGSFCHIPGGIFQEGLRARVILSQPDGTKSPKSSVKLSTK